MMLIKAVFERGPAVTRSPEGDPLTRIGDVGPGGIVGCDQSWDINKIGFGCRLTGEIMDGHRTTLGQKRVLPTIFP
jgi:hypothetical protein